MKIFFDYDKKGNKYLALWTYGLPLIIIFFGMIWIGFHNLRFLFVFVCSILLAIVIKFTYETLLLKH